MALALANRSVILAKMKFHIEAVHDLEVVLKSGDYPKATVYKLYQVKKYLYQKLLSEMYQFVKRSFLWRWKDVKNCILFYSTEIGGSLPKIGEI